MVDLTKLHTLFAEAGEIAITDSPESGGDWAIGPKDGFSMFFEERDDDDYSLEQKEKYAQLMVYAVNIVPEILRAARPDALPPQEPQAFLREMGE